MVHITSKIRIRPSAIVLVAMLAATGTADMAMAEVLPAESAATTAGPVPTNVTDERRTIDAGPLLASDLDTGPLPDTGTVAGPFPGVGMPAQSPPPEFIRQAQAVTDAAPVRPEQSGTPEIATRMPTSTEDFERLLKVLRARIQALENQQQRSELPVGQLAKNLEDARRDVERMAELLLRKEITEVRQRAAVLLSERRVESLTVQLDGTQEELEVLRDERNRLDSLVAESTSRVEELAGQLVELDSERDRLESMLDGSLEEAKLARAELEKADSRVAEINREMDDLIARNEKAEEQYEQQVAEARASMTLLEQRLGDERRHFEAEMRESEQRVATMQRSQESVRAVLEQALDEIREVSIEQSASEYELEMIRAADASDRARREVLGNLGFSRDKSGQLQLPEMDIAAMARRDADAIEPAAGPDPHCPDMGQPVRRAYLAGQDSAEWQHYLIGTLRFDQSKTRIDQAQLASIADCVATLGHSQGYYFKIVGHTDSVGAAPFNEELSLERARIARDLFLEKVAIQPWRLFAQGRGEGYPLASNDDERGRAANRRVEIFAVKAPF